MNPTKAVTAGGNGRKRPQLIDSISRLDSILDGLAEAIPATVADSVQQAVAAAVAAAVKEAVQAALHEAMTNPDILAALAARLPVPQPATPPEPVSQPAPAQPEKPKARRRWLTWLRAGWDRAVAWLAERRRAAGRWFRAVSRRLGAAFSLAWAVRRPLGIGLAAGAGVGVLAYLAGPLAAAILSALAVGALTTTGLLIVPVLRLLAQPDCDAE